MDCEACRDLMLDVLYGEAEPTTKSLVLEHHADCPACREELRALTALRSNLARWQLPSEVRPRPWPSRHFPSLAAAAALLIALASLALVFSRSARADRQWRDELARQELRHREEIRSLRASLADSPLSAVQERLGTPSAAAFRRIVEESETRQAEAFAARLSELRRKTETQRQYDLAQVSASLAYLEGKTGLQMARTTELMGHVLQVSQKR